MSAPGTLERRSSKRLATRQGSAPYVGKDAAKSGSTGITKYMENSSLDWDDKKASAPAASSSIIGRTMTFRKKGAGGKEKLPRNWKKAKEKDGTVYYINTVTQRRCHEVPPELPPGWREALHKDSGRVYYYHKATRQSTFEFPTAGDGGEDDDDDGGEEPPPAPEGFFGRTKSIFSRSKGKDKESIDRTSTMKSSKSFRPGSAAAAKKGGKAAEEKPAEGAGAQKTVFISCSTLIKEVKLCVGAEHQKALDSLYEKLTSHQLPAEQAVKQLMELVGSTVVQQAGLSVMNSQKGTLPHGWLEYIDEASGRPYYYNVHTKVTTWYKPSPTGAAPPPPPRKSSGDEIDMSVSIDTHNVAMTGFI